VQAGGGGKMERSSREGTRESSKCNLNFLRVELGGGGKRVTSM